MTEFVRVCQGEVIVFLKLKNVAASCIKKRDRRYDFPDVPEIAFRKSKQVFSFEAVKQLRLAASHKHNCKHKGQTQKTSRLRPHPSSITQVQGQQLPGLLWANASVNNSASSF